MNTMKTSLALSDLGNNFLSALMVVAMPMAALSFIIQSL